MIFCSRDSDSSLVGCTFLEQERNIPKILAGKIKFKSMSKGLKKTKDIGPPSLGPPFLDTEASASHAPTSESALSVERQETSDNVLSDDPTNSSAMSVGERPISSLYETGELPSEPAPQCAESLTTIGVSD